MDNIIQWNNLWFNRVAPYSIALGNDALAIGSPDGLKVLTAGEYVYADEDDDVGTSALLHHHYLLHQLSSVVILAMVFIRKPFERVKRLQLLSALDK